VRVSPSFAAAPLPSTTSTTVSFFGGSPDGFVIFGFFFVSVPTAFASFRTAALGLAKVGGLAAVLKLAKAVGTDTKKKPKIPKPSGSPPAKLTVVDIVKGKGAPAQSGDTLTVDYAGDSWSTGQEFDASWNRHQTFPVPLGQGQVIQGWDQGLLGMKPGGRRLLVIPPGLGYGAAGQPPKIKPNETLIFVVDLRSKS